MRTPVKLKKFAAPIVCPRLTPSLLTWMKVSRGTMKPPPKTPIRIRQAMTATRLEEKIASKIKKTPIPNPDKQESPSSILFREILPAMKDPEAMPRAVKRNRYPPATSLKFKD